jgi:hypothetical protein
MGIVIIAIIIIMFLFGLHELRSFALWAFTEHETDDDEPENEPVTHTRKILGNGFVYHSPIESEDENDVFNWTVERFRVEGDELKKDNSFGKNIF